MSFLTNLKNKLFKTSNQISGGLEDIFNNSSDTKEKIEELGLVDDKRDLKLNDQKKVLKVDQLKKMQSSKRSSNLLKRVIAKVDIIKPKRLVDSKLIEKLEDLLISADIGVLTSTKIVNSVSKAKSQKSVDVDELKIIIADEITKILEPISVPLNLIEEGPQDVLVVGVNGSGKTTTIGKLASQYKNLGKKVMIAAGDTFRAAAVEQLSIWSERAGVPIIKLAVGADPAALAFEAISKAEEQQVDILFIDTAGRLQNRTDLMEELAKVVRVIKKKNPQAPHNCLLILDATVGQNAVSQVEIFSKIANVSGLIMTKLDGTAKGGILVSLAEKFKLPIHAIGLGEGIEDLQPFDPRDYADIIVGLNVEK